MAKILEHIEIALDDLVIGKAQARTEDVDKDIDQLAMSIEACGQLHPIIVCEAEEKGKWEILSGQRRFLAHQKLGKEKIEAKVLDGQVSETEAKAISITENLVRRKLSGKELTDGITFLYNKYGSIGDVSKATGLSPYVLKPHIRYPRLIEALKKLVDSGEVELRVALDAQDAATDSGTGNVNEENAVVAAKEMQQMSGGLRKSVKREMQKNRSKSVHDVVEDCKGGSGTVELKVTLSSNTKEALDSYKQKEDIGSEAEAAMSLIEDALTDKGFLADR